ncbi:hypothetical protein GALMADRAFT_230311 [Galerina marginata CBS 339.88]|uniref:Protein kinase domain-containing protein n=1 Tax=Galerina marginata (strain CBS 339.88) TaxID=685588 RepID=A0A067STA0_GALM3|nr:hypothetical protein GALMADRAFT_230311 [Galerina marginata CBS 339.88]
MSPHQLTRENDPFLMPLYTNLYKGKLGEDKVIVKAWRSVGMDQSSQINFKKRLEVELYAWQAASSHPNIAKFVGLTQSDSSIPALVLPEYRHGNVNEFISRCQNADILQLLCGVASGLQYLHSRKPPIVHGKVQGSNILVSDNGEPQLSDLGMRNLPYPVDLTTANTRESLNEVRWMAPELINTNPDEHTEDNYPLTPPNDVHSFGMTALEIITRHPPFSHRRHVYGVIMDITSGIRPSRPESAQMTDDIWDLLTKCWSHEAKDRPNMDVVTSWVGILQFSRLAQSFTSAEAGNGKDDE